MRAVDVRQRCCKLEKAEGCHKGTVIGERDAVLCGSEAKGQQHRQVALVDGVAEMSGHQRSDPFVDDNLRAGTTIAEVAQPVELSAMFLQTATVRGSAGRNIRCASSARH